tara:strand:+ start:150 stop:329 length:180 start_codon:yes stop_codon:yes gene_type:complete
MAFFIQKTDDGGTSYWCGNGEGEDWHSAPAGGRKAYNSNAEATAAISAAELGGATVVEE